MYLTLVPSRLHCPPFSRNSRKNLGNLMQLYVLRRNIPNRCSIFTSLNTKSLFAVSLKAPHARIDFPTILQKPFFAQAARHKSLLLVCTKSLALRCSCSPKRERPNKVTSSKKRKMSSDNVGIRLPSGLPMKKVCTTFRVPSVRMCQPVCVDVPSDTEAVLGGSMKLTCISCLRREEIKAKTRVDWYYMPTKENGVPPNRTHVGYDSPLSRSKLSD